MRDNPVLFLISLSLLSCGFFVVTGALPTIQEFSKHTKVEKRDAVFDIAIGGAMFVSAALILIEGLVDIIVNGRWLHWL